MPRNTQLVLQIVQSQPQASLQDIVQLAEVQGSMSMGQYAQTILRLLREAGLVERQKLGKLVYFHTTELGHMLQQELALPPSLFADLIHYVFYTEHERQQYLDKTRSGWSWVYQATCRLLWEMRPFVPTFFTQAANLNERLLADYPDYTGGVHPKSPNAVEFWLRELDPPFLLGKGAKRLTQERSWCSPELLVLGVDRLYKQQSVSCGTPILLAGHALAELSALCLMGERGLQDVLEVAVSTFQDLDTHSGEWGRSVILSRPLSILDIL